MLEAGRLLQHAVGVHPAAVREGVLADVRLVGVRRAVEQLVEVVGRLGERREAVRREAVVAELELQVRDDRREVGVAAALAVAVHRPLHVRRAGLDPGQRVRHATADVVVRVDAHAHAARRQRSREVARRLGDLPRQRPAVRVAQDDRLGAGLGGREHAAARVRRVVAPAVEAVLGVVDDAFALRDEERDRLRDHAQVLVALDPQHLVDVQAPRLPHDRHDGREAVGEHAQRRVVLRARVAAPGHPERDDLGGRERLAREQLEQLELLRVRSREACLDEVDAERVEPVRDAQLLLGGERHALALHAVAERRVEQLDGGHGGADPLVRSGRMRAATGARVSASRPPR